jgi:SNF2 family DNA or RNA helicase
MAYPVNLDDATIKWATDWVTRCEKFEHKEQQLLGVLKLLEMPAFFLADEVGVGKTKQVIDAAQLLFIKGDLDTMLVLTPGFARSTWAEEDPLLGEVAKHAWDDVPNVIHEYHKNYTRIQFHPKALNWVVSNYEFIRRDERYDALDKLLRGRRTWLICDESWAIKGNSDQMRACGRLRRRRAERATMLNGTPLADGKPEDMFYPLTILDPDILGTSSKTSFRSKYCIMGGYDGKKVVGYQNLDDFNAKISPYVLSRRTRDCWPDMPPMLDPVLIEARMSNEEWKIYKDMRDDMVSWLGSSVSTASQAIVKSLRLAQICSGYLGGLEELGEEEADLLDADGHDPRLGPVPAWLRRVDEQTTPVQGQSTPSAQAAHFTGPVVARTGTGLVREIGRSKLDAFLNWLDTREPQPHKLLVWARFRPELTRIKHELEKVYPTVLELRGGVDKEPAKRFLAPGSDPRPGAVCGNQKAGGASLNLAAANIAVYMSNGPALIERTQSIGRIERPGATQPMQIIDVIATGPKGQKTFDHAVLKALRGKDDMARWTVDRWRQLGRELKVA